MWKADEIPSSKMYIEYQNLKYMYKYQDSTALDQLDPKHACLPFKKQILLALRDRFQWIKDYYRCIGLMFATNVAHMRKSIQLKHSKVALIEEIGRLQNIFEIKVSPIR